MNKDDIFKNKNYRVRNNEDIRMAFDDMDKILKSGHSVDATIGAALGTSGFCDFCNCPAPTWAYPCKDFESAFSIEVNQDNSITKHTQNSIGDWAACDICHDLIESGQIERLKEHMFSDELKDSVSRLALKQALDQLNRFFENRLGPPYKEKFNGRNKR